MYVWYYYIVSMQTFLCVFFIGMGLYIIILLYIYMTWSKHFVFWLTYDGIWNEKSQAAMFEYINQNKTTDYGGLLLAIIRNLCIYSERWPRYVVSGWNNSLLSGNEMDLKLVKKRCPSRRSPWFLLIDVWADQCREGYMDTLARYIYIILYVGEEANYCENDVTLRNQYW